MPPSPLWIDGHPDRRRGPSLFRSSIGYGCVSSRRLSHFVASLRPTPSLQLTQAPRRRRNEACHASGSRIARRPCQRRLSPRSNPRDTQRRITIRLVTSADLPVVSGTARLAAHWVRTPAKLEEPTGPAGRCRGAPRCPPDTSGRHDRPRDTHPRSSRGGIHRSAGCAVGWLGAVRGTTSTLTISVLVARVSDDHRQGAQHSGPTPSPRPSRHTASVRRRARRSSRGNHDVLLPDRRDAGRR